MINLTREEAQQVLDALKHLCAHTTAIKGYDGHKVQPPINMLKAKLKQPKNSFNPDWEAMAVMVEEQQRMAKQIEELDIALAEQDAKYLDAVETLDDEGWTWDGDQWQRPATRSEKLREARITRRPRGWSKEDEPEPVAWTVGGLITDFSRDFSAYKTKTYTQPLYTTPPQRKPEPEPVAVVALDTSTVHMYVDTRYVGKKPETKTAIFFKDLEIGTPLYTAPPQREWVGLTEEELEFYTEELGLGELGRGVLRAVDDFLLEKNSG